MTNVEFQKHLEDVRASHDIVGRGPKMTVNELFYMLRMDNAVQDYNVNLVYEDDTMACVCSVKECFVPVRDLALYVKSVEYDEFDYGIPEDICLLTVYVEK